MFLFLYLCLVFQSKSVKKKSLKITEDKNCKNFLEIGVGREKFVLVKFYGNVNKEIWRLISKNNVQERDTSNIVAGQTEFRPGSRSFFRWYFLLL